MASYLVRNLSQRSAKWIEKPFIATESVSDSFSLAVNASSVPPSSFFELFLQTFAPIELRELRYKQACYARGRKDRILHDT
jgi:hypothetical protein